MRCLVRLIAFLMAAQVSAGAAFAADEKPVTLGAVYGLTGAWSAYGLPSSRGAQLFVDQANAKGGVLERPLQLIVEDSESSIDGTAEAARALLSKQPEVVALFGLSESDPVRVAGEVAAKAERIFVTSGATSPKLPSEVPTYLFLACFGDNVQAAAAAEFAVSRLGARSVSILYDDSHTYTRLLQGYFRRAFEALGGEVRAHVKFDGAETIGSALDQLAEADIIFLATETPADSLAGAKALRAKGFDQPIVGGDGYDGERVWQAEPGLKDIYFSTHAYFGGDHPSPIVAAFREAYMAENGGVEPASFAGLGYDTAGLLAAAVEKAQSTAPDKVLAALSSIRDYQGVTGTISFVGGSRIPLKSVTILKVAEGQRQFVEQLVPRQVPSP